MYVLLINIYYKHIMCGIFGYVGKDNAAHKIIEGLKRLEYRGYDSWGVAVIEQKLKDAREIKVYKKVGPIGDFENLLEFEDLPSSHMGIGHTRWATHGGVTFVNAHPHYFSDESFVLAQNGIVENYQELKAELSERGYKFENQTDTEVIVHLVEEKLKEVNDIKLAVRKAFQELKGRNTIILLKGDEDHVLAVRNGSPLVIGVGKGEYFFASDTLSFADKTDKVIFMNDFEMVEYKNGDVTLSNVRTDEVLDVEIKKLEHGDITIDKEGYNHFMLKEMMEQVHTIRQAISYSEKDFDELVKTIKKAKNVYTVGAGGAFYAADQVAYLLREIAGVRAMGLRPYEIDSYENFLEKDDVIIAISQSGETADTLEALAVAKRKGLKVASAVNMVGSTITRLSDYPFFSRTGSEICVLSTKSGSAQVAFGYLLAKIIKGEFEDAVASVDKLSDMLEEYLNETFQRHIEVIASKIKNKEHIFLLGKGRNYLVAQVGALNIKEASYLHAEGFAAGELKHGVIALIEEGTPVICFVDEDKDRDYMIGATAEVKARGAYVIGVGVKENELFDEFIELPTSSGIDAAIIANIIPCQLLAYYLAIQRGYNPDKPRNLAKSVTVK